MTEKDKSKIVEDFPAILTSLIAPASEPDFLLDTTKERDPYHFYDLRQVLSLTEEQIDGLYRPELNRAALLCWGFALEIHDGYYYLRIVESPDLGGQLFGAGSLDKETAWRSGGFDLLQRPVTGLLWRLLAEGERRFRRYHLNVGFGHNMAQFGNGSAKDDPSGVAFSICRAFISATKELAENPIKDDEG